MLNPWAEWMGLSVGTSTRKGPLSPSDLATPLPARRVDVDGVRINTIVAGPEGGVPTVFLHGLSAWMGFWHYQIPEFARTRRVMALDLPGYGGSEAPDAPYTPSWFAGRVCAWLDALHEGPVDLVAHSLGGHIALWLAAMHPERVRRIVLVAPAGIETFTPLEATMMKAVWTEDRALGTPERTTRRNFLGAVFARADEHVEHLVDERVRTGLHPRFARTSRAVARSVAGMLDEPVHHLLPRIQAPTLVVFGGRDALIPNRVFHPASHTRVIADRAVSAMPDARLCWLDTAGHTAHHDEPVRFNRAVMRFLES